ncbi:MAG: hypothetical protein Q8N98_04720 [bacterium]|nr:hypothetical protein [bacterium]
MERVLKILPKVVEKLRAMSPVKIKTTSQQRVLSRVSLPPVLAEGSELRAVGSLSTRATRLN